MHKLYAEQSHIRYMFLPKNSTSKLQACDLLYNAVIKSKYKKSIVRVLWDIPDDQKCARWLMAHSHRYLNLTRIREMHLKRKKKRKLYKLSHPVILHQRNKSLLSKLWKVEKSTILESKIVDFCQNLLKKSLLFWIWTVDW